MKFSSFGDAMLNMSRPSNTGYLYYKARNLIYKKTNAEHHKLFFKDCVDKNLIPFGLQFNFHPVACSSINVDLTSFIKHRLKDVSSETVQILYSKYTVQENIANNKFENYKDYVIGKLPYRISKQSLDHVNSSNMRLKKNLLKRRKKKISRLEKFKRQKEKKSPHKENNCSPVLQEHFYLDIQTDDSEYYTSFSELDLNPCDLKIYNKDDEKIPSSCSLFADEDQQKNVSDSVNSICPSDPISNFVASPDILQIPLNTVWSDADFSICTDPHIDSSGSTYLISYNNAVEPITISTDHLQVISGEYSPIIGQIPTITKRTACRRFIVNLRKRKNRKQGCTLSTDHHAPINFSSVDLPPGTVRLLKKGPFFVPTQKFVDWGKLSTDLIKFKNKLRWRARYGDTGDDPAYDSEEDLFDCFKLPSGKDAPRSSDQALELFSGTCRKRPFPSGYC